MPPAAPIVAFLIAQAPLSGPALPPRSVNSTIWGFAAEDSQLDLAFVLGSPPVSVSMKSAPESGPIYWTLQAATGETVPEIQGSPGTQVSFAPSVDGNFQLIAFTGDERFDSGRSAILCVARLAILRAIAQEDDGPRPFVSSSIPASRVSGMSLAATYTLSSGGSTIGASKIVLGNVGNVIEDSFQVHYTPEGTARENTGGLSPLLDTLKTVGPAPSGGAIFRERSSASGTGTPTVSLSSQDSPVFTWESQHPANGNPVGRKTGSYRFREYVVAYSLSFPNVYTPLFQQDWIASPCAGQQWRLAPSEPVPPGSKVALVPPRFVDVRKMVYDPPIPADRTLTHGTTC